MKIFRLIRSLPESAEYNMALDKEILSRYLQDGVPVLRIYSWRSPSITYGVSLEPADHVDRRACLLDGVSVVKRITGGGVLFHNHEITYSLACSKEDIGEDPRLFVSYRRICAFLIKFYSSLGLKPSFAVESGGFAKMSIPSRLCSASHEKYDIVVKARKIGGNAQRRTRQAVFQHGSIPLSIDWDLARRYIPSLPDGVSSGATCLREELAYLPERDVLEDKLLRAFADTYNIKFNGDSDHCNGRCPH